MEEEILEPDDVATRPIAGATVLDYRRLLGEFLRDVASVLRAWPLVVVAAELTSLLAFLSALHAVILGAVAIAADPSASAVVVDILVLAFEVSPARLATFVGIAALTWALLLFAAQATASRLAVKYERVCNERAVEAYVRDAAGVVGPESPAQSSARLKRMLAVSRGDSRSCGTAVQIVLSGLPSAVALTLFITVLLVLYPLVTLALVVGMVLVAVPLVALNRRGVRLTRQLDQHRLASYFEHTALFRSSLGKEIDPKELARARERSATRAYLDNHRRRLLVRNGAQLLMNLTFAFVLATLLPVVVLEARQGELDVVRIVLYVLILRFAFGHARRLVGSWTAFNQHYPALQRYFAEVPPRRRGASRS